MSTVTQSWSFRTKLTLSFVALSFMAITGVAVSLTTLSNQRAVTALRDKATSYSRLISPQVRSVVAFDDKLTAREVFDSFGADPDVAGLAVYRADGRLIGGYGAFPDVIGEAPTDLRSAGHVIVIAPVTSPEGPRGRLYVSISTRALEQVQRRSMITAVSIGLGALCVAVLIATALARPVALRVGTIAKAAALVAQGDLNQPEIAPGPGDEIGRLARAFNIMVAELRRQFVERAQLAATEQARLEAIVAIRTGELEESREQYRLVAETTNAIPFTYLPATEQFTYVGPQAENRLGYSIERWKQPGLIDALVPFDEAESVRRQLNRADSSREFEFECTGRTADKRSLQLRWVVTCGDSHGERCLRGLILDISDRRRLESELAQAQKLESVGRLAAGVAHEINTPTQFVSDSVSFVRDGMNDLLGVVGTYRQLCATVIEDQPSHEAAAAAIKADQDADLDYLIEQMPEAIVRSLDGLDRITTIVRAMKEFAHPDQREMSSVDINQAIHSTLIVARNEYKYVAELQTDLGDIPLVTCHAGDINQAILNVVINAAHAIGDVAASAGERGRLMVSTRTDGDAVEIRIKDTGGGIPEAIRDRIFDPFFTTKEVGKGTGQGLAIARSVIKEKHGGDLTFETELGTGTTFIIRLPIAGWTRRVDAAA